MKKLVLLVAILSTLSGFSQVIKTTATEVSFFSKSPVEDIEAVNKKMTAAINVDTKMIAFSVPIRGFVFDKSLMQEHFNENYMESAKYPSGTFKGKINEAIDFKVNGTYKVTTTGTFVLHGVSKPRTFEGTLTIQNGVVTLVSAFKVKLVDHDIERPSILLQNIAEVIDVKLKATFKN